jgi:hypothetical protein
MSAMEHAAVRIDFDVFDTDTPREVATGMAYWLAPAGPFDQGAWGAIYDIESRTEPPVFIQVDLSDPTSGMRPWAYYIEGGED